MTRHCTYVAVLSIDLLDNEEGSQGEVGLKHGGTQSPSFVSSVFETGYVHDYESFQPTNSKSVATFDINSDTISQAENLQESSMQATSLPSVSLLPETPKNFKKVLQLRSPTTTEIRSLKIYTDIEIKRGKGQDQAYKIFWNERVRKMAKRVETSSFEASGKPCRQGRPGQGPGDTQQHAKNIRWPESEEDEGCNSAVQHFSLENRFSQDRKLASGSKFEDRSSEKNSP